MEIKNIVFDLGGVLINWDPRNMYRKIFSDSAQMEYFLKTVCHQEWNEKQDAGRSFADGIAELLAQFPGYKNEILAYDTRWEEMLNGSIQGTVDILGQIKSEGRYRLLGLSNWSKDKFPTAIRLFDFLAEFEDIVVSGYVGLKKPDPEIFKLLCKKNNILPEQSLFIDDVLHNIEAARRLGFHTVLFVSPEQLTRELRGLNILS